jgi:hypothetical protein
MERYIMAKQRPAPPLSPTSIDPRDLQLIGIALELGIDSDDLDDACRESGINPRTADLSDVSSAARSKFGLPNFWRR